MHGDFRRRVVASREAGIADSLQYLQPARGRFEAFAEGSRVALPVAISVNHGLLLLPLFFLLCLLLFSPWVYRDVIHRTRLKMLPAEELLYA